jgi:hypothetical protein
LASEYINLTGLSGNDASGSSIDTPFHFSRAFAASSSFANTIKPNLYNNDPSNYDLNATGESSTGSYNWNYISTLDEDGSNIGGHIIIVRLRVNLDGTGVVEYVDPLAPNHNPSNRKFVSYTRLLNSMAMNGLANTSYDAISIGLK